MTTQLWVPAVLVLFLSHYVLPSSASSAATQTPSAASKSDRERSGLRGAVKTCTEESTLPDGSESSTYREYGPDGKLLLWSLRNPDSPAWVTTRTYDGEGRLIRIVSDTSSEVYKYDDAGSEHHEH
jgi:YD repeat-containing protein